MALEYAYKTIEIIAPILEEGNAKQHNIYIRLIKEASIKVATELYDNTKLEKALEIIEIGAKYQEDWDAIHFTKAQILLKLKREEEAYTLIEKAMSKEKYVKADDFKEILTSKAYQKWYDRFFGFSSDLDYP